jgi:hypothetical protein
MENVLKYYEFSSFFKDNSGVFNDTHFLIFEKEEEKYNLYVSRYRNDKEIGFEKPEILETVIKNYKKSSPTHRIALRKYIE